MQDGVVTLAPWIATPNRSQQPSNQRPVERPRRRLSTIDARHIDDMKAGWGVIVITAVPQESPNVSDDMLERLPLVLLALHLNVGLDIGGGKVRKAASGSKPAGHEVRHRRTVVL